MGHEHRIRCRLEDDGVAPVTVDISGVSTDDQTVDGLTFNAGTGELAISLEDDGAAPVTVDISGVSTDDQTVDGLTFNAGTGELAISLEDDGVAPVTVDVVSTAGSVERIRGVISGNMVRQFRNWFKDVDAVKDTVGFHLHIALCDLVPVDFDRAERVLIVGTTAFALL